MTLWKHKALICLWAERGMKQVNSHAYVTQNVMLWKKKPFCSIYTSYKWYGKYSKARLSGELCQKVNKNANLPLHNLLNLS